MTHVADLATPAVPVDLDILERNVARLQERARQAAVKLRPHVRAHKSPEVRMLLRLNYLTRQ